MAIYQTIRAICPNHLRSYCYQSNICLKHRLLRKVISKGTSLENLTQWDCTLITNHINSYARKTLGGICPYDVTMEVYEEDFFDLLELERISHNAVNLTPQLIFHK